MKASLLSISSILIVILLLVIGSNANLFYTWIETSSLWIRDIFGPIYLFFGLFCVGILVVLSISKYGAIKIGGLDKPEYSFTSWIAMLYSAGMGSGILLRAVQEPVFMQQNLEIGGSKSRSIMAMEFTFYQWGFTAWAFYTILALIVSFYIFRMDRPVRISSVWTSSVKPLRLVHGADILVLLTTMFGLIAALGLGVTQINGGLAHLYPNTSWDLSTTIYIMIIIAGLALWSSWKGLHKGIRLWSNLNMVVTTALTLWLLFQSDLGKVFGLFSESLWAYITDFIPLSLALPPYHPGSEFLSDWTYYYWAFWIAWAPFIGIFIARISKGRSIRQMVVGVLIIPSFTTFIWFSIMGQNAFSILENPMQSPDQFSNVFTSIFVFFNHFPASTYINIVVISLLAGFLITSLDSSIYVMAMITDEGRYRPSKRHRLVWGILLAGMGMALLWLGYAREDINVLIAVQKLLILTSLPLVILIIIMVIRLLKDFISLKK